MRNVYCIFVTVVVFSGVLLPNPIQARVIHVRPGGNDANDGSTWALAKKTVGAGLHVAFMGDDVWVAAGTYNERISLRTRVSLLGGFTGKETSKSQRDVKANVTILDGQDGGSVVTCPAGLQSSTCIDGFTIRNGYAEFGGGIVCISSSPTISNNTISGNTATEYGAGIYCESSFASITNNTISDNYGSGGFGGGIGCVNASPTIQNNIIDGNDADIYGGGIYCDSSSPLIANNTISNNYSYHATGGGIYYEGSSSPSIVNNIITNNYANTDCGGIYGYSDSPSVIANNTITKNHSSWFDEGVGGIGCGSSVLVVNNIIAFNHSGIRGSLAVLRNNCVYNPYGDNYVYTLPGPGDISVDPGFVDLDAGNWHLAAGSPCINQGSDADVQTGWLDIDGQPRIAGAHVDMGADEVFIPGDANGDDKVDVSDLGILAANYGTTSGATWATGDFNGDGKVDVSDLGILAANYGTGTGTALDFNADMNSLSLTAEGKEEIPAASPLGCGTAALPLMAGLFVTGLWRMKLE